MKEVRYRTEAFGGSKVRDAAKVMAFETFQLGNTDILEHLSEHVIKDPDLLDKCAAFIQELDDNGFVDDMTEDDQEAFYRAILSEVGKQTGIPIKYSLWLADIEVVTNRKWYGRDMADDDDFDSYEIGPVILSDLGGDGTLYGYTEMPIPLEEKIERLQDQLIDVINQRENDNLSFRKAQQLDEQYLELDNQIQEIKNIFHSKHTSSSPLDDVISDARARADLQKATTHPASEKAMISQKGPLR